MKQFYQQAQQEEESEINITPMLDVVFIMLIFFIVTATFIKEAGVDIGNSLYDEEGAKLVPEIRKKAEEKGVELILPVDFVCSSKFGDDGEIQEGDMSTGVPEGFLGLDIGPKSIAMNDEARVGLACSSRLGGLPALCYHDPESDNVAGHQEVQDDRLERSYGRVRDGGLDMMRRARCSFRTSQDVFFVFFLA